MGGVMGSWGYGVFCGVLGYTVVCYAFMGLWGVLWAVLRVDHITIWGSPTTPWDGHMTPWDGHITPWDGHGTPWDAHIILWDAHMTHGTAI